MTPAATLATTPAILIATLAAEPYLMALRSRQSAMASRMAPLTNRTSKRLAMSPRLPSA